MLRRPHLSAAVLLAGTILSSAAPARAAGCTIPIGVVMELTGPAGEYGQAGAKSVEMAFRDLNEAGGAQGCDLVADTRDSHSTGDPGGRRRHAARPGATRAGHHRRHHIVGDDPDPHGRDRTRQDRPGVAGVLDADA